MDSEKKHRKTGSSGKVRFILKIIPAGIVLFSFLYLLPGCKTDQPATKPNLLFIWTDEQQAATMGAYGIDVIRTPGLDKLAGASYVFEKCYVSQPVCSPSRATVMTGLYPHTTGIVYNNISLRDSTRCFPELLDDPSYRTAYMGKWHLGDELFAQHGFETWVSIEDGYNRFFSEGKDRDARSSYHHWLIEKGYPPSHPDRNLFSRTYAASLPLEHSKTVFLREKACQFLEEHQDEPFILYVNYLEPHMPFTGPLDSLYPPDEVPLPENFDDPLDESEPLRYRLYREYCMEAYGSSGEEIRQLIARYWGLVSQVDRSVGAILDKLDSLGLTENTIVVFTSDHGDMMGAHHLVEKQVMFEESVRVPLLIRVPTLSVDQVMIRRNISQIDLVPTLLDLMGKSVPGYLQGKSLVPLLKGEEPPEEDVFIQWNPYDFYMRWVKEDTRLATEDEIREAVSSRTRTVVSPEGWKLCLRDSDLPQLYNLKEDPLETTNLYPDPSNRQIIRSLAERIHRWQQQTGDTVTVGASGLMRKE